MFDNNMLCFCHCVYLKRFLVYLCWECFIFTYSALFFLYEWIYGGFAQLQCHPLPSLHVVPLIVRQITPTFACFLLTAEDIVFLLKSY